MDKVILLNLIILAMGLVVGFTLGKAIARDDAARSGRFKFAGKTYKVEVDLWEHN
jgi:hypothetical protein